MRLDSELARAAFERLDTPLSFEQRVAYAYKIGLNNIAEGLIDVAIKQGINPREYSLIAYGAAGPLLLPAVLSMVKARRVIVPPYPGLFSALGLLSSDLVYSDNRSAYMLLVPGVADNISQIYRAMEEKLLSRISSNQQDVVIRRTFDGRLYGQTWETPFIEVPPGEITEETNGTFMKNFHDVYEQRTGNRFEMIPVQSVTYRVEVIVPTGKVSYPHLPAGQPRTLQPERVVTLHYLEDGEIEVAEYEGEKLQRGDVMRGSAIIREPLSTTHIVRGQTATIGEWGEIVIELER